MSRSSLVTSALMVVVLAGCASEGEDADLEGRAGADSEFDGRDEGDGQNEGDGESEPEQEGEFEGADEVDATTEALSLWDLWFRRDAGARDAATGPADAAVVDGGSARDGGAVDAGSPRDAGSSDASLRDSGPSDASSRDAAAQADAAPSRDAATPADGGAPAAGRSSGCGRAASGNDAFEKRTKSVNGTTRTYHVRVPAAYDKDRAYPVVFRWHGSGGNGLSGGLDIQYSSGANAIIVGADGINSGWTGSSEANDLALFDAMLEELSQQYCIDLSRVFAYGFSAGGGFTNAVGCKRASKIRATAAIAGFDRGDSSCEGAPVAAWFQHDVTDPAVSISQGRGARDRAIRRNGCTTEATMENGCVRYAGCKAGSPVIWCETNGLGHDIAGGTAPAKVWQFFSTLP